MTIAAHAQTRRDLDVADRLVRLCWDNFKATEPTFVLRDLIAIELATAREWEREQAAKIADGFEKQGDWHAETAQCIAASIRGREDHEATLNATNQ
jgi:hypothetical protein